MGRTDETDPFEGFDDDALLDLTLSATDDRYWELVQELHRRGTPEIFRRALELTTADSADDRGTGADVLRQLGLNDGYPFVAESLPALIRLTTDEEPFVVDSALRAIGALGAHDGLDAVIAAASHQDAEVREAVSSAAASLAGLDPVGVDHPAITVLLRLMTDPAANVRDWSTFGLGTQTNADGPEIRQAFVDRLDDSDHDTRCEAMVALARRRDPRVLSHVASELAQDSVGRLALESATYLRSPELLPALAELEFGNPGDEPFAQLLEVARRRCDPARCAEEVDLLHQLIDAGNAHVPPLAIALSCEVLPIGDGEVEIGLASAGDDPRYQLDALLLRACGSIEAMVELIAADHR